MTLPRPTLHFGVNEALGKLFNDDKTADFTIKCNGETFHVHKLIIGCQGGFFDFLNHGTWLESPSKVIDLDICEHEPRVVEAVLRYMYGVEYHVPHSRDEAGFHAEVYFAADFFQLPLLKQDVIADFMHVASRDQDGIRSCLSAAKDIYQHCAENDKDLRNAVADIVDRNMQWLLPDKASISQLQQDVPDLVAELLLRKSKPRGLGW